ncbi:MAG: peptidoglycan endopeptidase [Desulfotignum sp.]|nr:peptidoglycan endopeptidase [Desulfotignum sp.]MCF8112763.1 peptidoglycan endopeptidase [Desulfotignum sp.]MCF8125142.1 peptidoglycan endopeptidase [Desulfotignum sp.]
MKKYIFTVSALILLNAFSAWGVQFEKNPFNQKPERTMARDKQEIFRQNIPAVARQFVGIPYQYGGNPLTSGTSDNSYLFFSIYSKAAQLAGLRYHGYLPMANLLQHTQKVDESRIQKGDLMVLDNQLAALIYDIEKTGRLHLIYASEKRSQVITFHSDNLVFYAYWMENLMGFYRLKDTMLRPE